MSQVVKQSLSKLGCACVRVCVCVCVCVFRRPPYLFLQPGKVLTESPSISYLHRMTQGQVGKSELPSKAINVPTDLVVRYLDS